MKILLAAFTAALMLVGCVNTSKSNKPMVVLREAPDFTLKNVLGGEVKSDDLKGKVVVLDFWATWCTPCKVEIPNYLALLEEFKDQPFAIVGVTFDSGKSEKDVLPFVKDLRISYPVVMGTDAVDADFGGHPGYPTTFLIGKDWKVYRKMFGVQDNKKELLARDITILLNKEYDPPIASNGSDTATVETVELK